MKTPIHRKSPVFYLNLRPTLCEESRTIKSKNQAHNSVWQQWDKNQILIFRIKNQAHNSVWQQWDKNQIKFSSLE